MSEAPLVSILTPSFNQGRYITDCLKSVAQQSYPNIEHIIMDGGSTDETVSELRKTSNPRLIWNSEPDRGQSHALLKAFEVSRGEIIGWVNADDGYATATVIRRVVDAFHRSPDVGVIYSHAVVVNDSGVVLHILKAPSNVGVLSLGSRIYQPTVFSRRRVFQEHGFVDETFDLAMDYELWIRLRNRGVRFCRLDTIGAVDRHHASRKVERLRSALKVETDRIRPALDVMQMVHWRAVNIGLRWSSLTLIGGLYSVGLLPMWKLPWRSTLLARQMFVARRFQS